MAPENGLQYWECCRQRPRFLRTSDPATSYSERAERIVENCAYPTYRPLPRRYLELSQGGHSPNTLKHAPAFHTAYQQTGSMLIAEL